MSQQPQGQPGQAAGQPQVLMLRPEQMRSIPYLNPEDKAKYERGLQSLYNQYNNNPPDSIPHQTAKKKIQDFSVMVQNKVRSLREQSQQRQQAQAQAQGQGQQSQQAQPGQQVPQPGQPQQGQRPPTAAANNAQGQAAGGAAQAGQSTGTGGQTQAQGQPQQLKLPDHVMNHLSQMKFYHPPQLDGRPDQIAKWTTDMKMKYAKGLMAMEQNTMGMNRIDAAIKDRGDKMSPEEMKRMTDQKLEYQRRYNDAAKFVTGFRNQQKILHEQKNQAGGQAQQQNAGAQGQAQPQRPTAAPLQAQQSGGAGAGNSLGAATSQVNAAMEAAKNQQLAAQNRGQPATPQATNSQAVPTPTSATAPNNQSTAPASNNVQVKVEPGTHPVPPPVNTAVAAAASSAQIPSAGTPTQNSARVQTPQSATPTTGPPRSLSHQAAISLANRQPQNPVIPNQQLQSGAPTTPGSAGQQTGGHPHAHPPQQINPQMSSSRMPIPRNLPEKAQQVPQPVAMGGGVAMGRPTMGAGAGIGSGVINQPIIQKPPGYSFEAEGEHVLSKKKLDELVRQVCGGGPPGADGNYLTPDVEENVLSVADNFVDNVLHTACKLAKERGSKVLEIRDIQMVLERIYNIRVPGYTSDELRTVRQIKPSQNWITKMTAIQAAKVMPGKDDK